MAFFEFNFFSESIGMSTSCNILMPQRTAKQIGLTGVGSPDGCPVLYLLHGLSDDHSIWMRRTSIERYATQYGIAVVMPNCHRSYYNDTAYGLQYWTFLSQELPDILASSFRFSQKREDTFAAGLSMGGFGAFKLALNCPERFAAAASISGALSPQGLLKCCPDRKAEFTQIFGGMSKVPKSQNDLYFMAEQAAANHVCLPKLFQICGTEDFLYQENLKFKHHLEKLGIDFQYKEEPGTHEWGFWDRNIQEILRWLPIQHRPKA